MKNRRRSRSPGHEERVVRAFAKCGETGILRSQLLVRTQARESVHTRCKAALHQDETPALGAGHQPARSRGHPHIEGRGNTLRSLANRARERERELPRQCDDPAPALPRSRFWSAQRQEPLGLRELPEIELWAAKMRLQTAGIRDGSDLALIWRKANRIQREGCRLIPHG